MRHDFSDLRELILPSDSAKQAVSFKQCAANALSYFQERYLKAGISAGAHYVRHGSGDASLTFKVTGECGYPDFRGVAIQGQTDDMLTLCSHIDGEPELWFEKRRHTPDALVQAPDRDDYTYKTRQGLLEITYIRNQEGIMLPVMAVAINKGWMRRDLHYSLPEMLENKESRRLIIDAARITLRNEYHAAQDRRNGAVIENMTIHRSQQTCCWSYHAESAESMPAELAERFEALFEIIKPDMRERDVSNPKITTKRLA